MRAADATLEPKERRSMFIYNAVASFLPTRSTDFVLVHAEASGSNDELPRMKTLCFHIMVADVVLIRLCEMQNTLMADVSYVSLFKVWLNSLH